MSPPAGGRSEGETWQRVEGKARAIIADASWRVERSDDCLLPADVHALRVSCKRLRSLWRMLEPAFGPATTRPAEGVLRDAAKELAGQRQAAVLVQTLERLGRKADKSKDRELAVDLALRLTVALEAPAALEGPQPLLRAAFERQETALAALPGRPTAEDLLLGILAGVERARKYGRRANRDRDATLWHRCRRWVKYEHYQLDLSLRPKGALRQRQRRLERLGVLLGRHQDGADLDQALASTDVVLALPDPVALAFVVWLGERDAGRLLTCVRRQQQRLLARIERGHEALYGGERKALEGLLRAAFARAR